VRCQLVQRKCPARKIVYVSNDPKRPKAVIVFQGRHSHPPWPEEKPSQEAKADLQKCLDALGILGATADKVDNGEHKVFTIPYHNLNVMRFQHLQQLHFSGVH
jgi:hypothetical protein